MANAERDQMSADPDICLQMIPNEDAGHIKTCGPLDNVPGNAERLAAIADAEMGFLTVACQAKLWGITFRDPGPGRPIEALVHNNHDGQYTVIPVEPMRALDLASELLKMAMRRL